MDSSLLPLLTGSAGAAGVLVAFIVLIMTGYLVPKRFSDKSEARIEFLEKALETEKKLNDELTSALAQNNQMIGTLKQIAIERVRETRETRETKEWNLSWNEIARDDTG